ncbi:hypothetical protein Tco_1048392 [Tanacetum coccineum]
MIFVLKVNIPKRKRTRRVAEEIGQNDEVANEANSKATDEEEFEPLIKHRNIGISIGRNTSQEYEAIEEGIDHSMKMKGPVTPSEATRYKSDMKKALNASKDDFIIQFC